MGKKWNQEKNIQISEKERLKKESSREKQFLNRSSSRKITVGRSFNN